MALTVETGSGKTAAANSYAAIVDADAYHIDRGNAVWTAANEAAKTAALINATAYLDGKYRARWKGVRVTSLQPLEWPRYGVLLESASINFRYPQTALFPTTAVPDAVKHAVCELALRALSSPLAPDVAPTDRLKRKKVDVIEKEFDTRGGYQPSFPVVDQLINRYLKGGNDLLRG